MNKEIVSKSITCYNLKRVTPFNKEMHERAPSSNKYYSDFETKELSFYQNIQFFEGKKKKKKRRTVREFQHISLEARVKE